MTLFNVSTTDRQQVRRIEAETPLEAIRAFVGRRLASVDLDSWTFNGKESFYAISVAVGDKPFRMGRDAVRSIRGHVWTD